MADYIKWTSVEQRSIAKKYIEIQRRNPLLSPSVIFHRAQSAALDPSRVKAVSPTAKPIAKWLSPLLSEFSRVAHHQDREDEKNVLDEALNDLAIKMLPLLASKIEPVIKDVLEHAFNKFNMEQIISSIASETVEAKLDSLVQRMKISSSVSIDPPKPKAKPKYLFLWAPLEFVTKVRKSYGSILDILSCNEDNLGSIKTVSGQADRTLIFFADKKDYNDRAKQTVISALERLHNKQGTADKLEEVDFFEFSKEPLAAVSRCLLTDL